MKQKTIGTPVTEDRLKIILKDTIDNSINNYDQKLTKRLLESQEAFRNELRHEFLMMNEAWERRFTAFESRLYSVIDPVLQEIKISRQEREVAAAQVAKVRSRTDDHENRITQLEQA
jgi:hypothetical protein